MSSYDLHPAAVEDIKEIWNYVAARNRPAADDLVSEFFDKFESIARSPSIGHRRPDLASAPIRFSLVHEYLIAYAPEGRRMIILAIIHGRRNPRVMGAILSGRNLQI